MSDRIDFWQKTSWFVVQTKSHSESVAAARVAKLDLEVFLPQVRAEESVRTGARKIAKALFPGYFFTRFCPLESIDAVRYTHGVSRVVGCGRFPTAVEGEIISSIQQQIRPDGFIRFEARGFRPGDKVTVEQGSFQGWMGEVQREQDDGKRVMILLEAIQQASLSVEKRWLSATALV
jgi:transcriptional antiterminator RfaH